MGISCSLSQLPRSLAPKLELGLICSRATIPNQRRKFQAHPCTCPRIYLLGITGNDYNVYLSVKGHLPNIELQRRSEADLAARWWRAQRAGKNDERIAIDPTQLPKALAGGSSLSLKSGSDEGKKGTQPASVHHAPVLPASAAKAEEARRATTCPSPPKKRKTTL